MQSTTDLPGALPPGLPDPATAAQLEALALDLRAAGLPLLRSAGELATLAADGFVYSPVLQPLLCGQRAQIGNRLLHHLRLYCKHHHCGGTPVRGGVGDAGMKPDIVMPARPGKMLPRRLDNGEFSVEAAVGEPAMKHGASHLAAANEDNERFHGVTGRGAGGATPPLR